MRKLAMVKRARARPILKAKKSQGAQDVLDRLNAFLNAAEPEPVYWLTRLWNDQQQAVTYKELREAIQQGYIDEKTLAAWQADYANFVNEHLKGIWQDAAKAANAALEAQHPDFFYDPMGEGIQNWTATHGAEWVTNISDDQREAITSMIDRATTGAWTGDELARAIRPLIGLTKPQALANLNYYEHLKATLLANNPTMKEATAAKAARDAAAKYAAKQHRQRAYTIATTELAYAYNKGADDGIIQAQQQGFIGKVKRVWSTAYDDGVCEICSALEGQEIDMDGEFDFKGKSLYAGQKKTPPAHPRCRCAVEYREVEPPEVEQQEPEQPPTTWGEPPEQDLPEPPSPAAAPSIPIPSGMTYQGKPNLGGTGEMHLYRNGAGQEWLFKPAQTKSGSPEAFRAYVQEAGYKVQYIVDPDTAVPVGVGELGGKFGAFQKRITTIGSATDYKAWQHSGGPLPDGSAQQFQREHVTDWLLGNYDSHGGNFVTDSAGRLVGIDKEQSFKYIGKDGAQAMSYAFHPNKSYGETEPIYNTIYRRFAKGELDLDLQDTLAYIKRVEAIPDSEYREIFRDYAEALHGKGKEAEALLDAIVERKDNLRETYRAFYSDLLTERTGRKQIFTWADEVAQQAKQPLAAVTHSADALKKMNVAELKQLAKQKGIPYYNKFNKKELIEAISDPVKAVEISAKTKAKLLNLESTRPERLGRTAEKPPRPPRTSAVDAGDLFQDFGQIPPQRIGVAVSSDEGMVEGLNLTARKVNLDGQDVYEITGKLAESTWSQTWDTLKKQSEVKQLTFEQADGTLALLASRPINMHGVEIKARTMEDSGGTFQLYVHNGSQQYNAWKGFFRLRVPATGNGAADAKAAKNLLNRAGLSGLASTPTAEAEAIFKKSRLLWQHAPGRMKELKGLQGGALESTLNTILQEEGIDPGRTGHMVMRKVFDGYQTLVEEGISAEYQKAGLKYLWAGVRRPEALVGMLNGKGFMSTNTRCLYGMDFTGASPGDDMRTGGSDSVFTRIGVKMKSGNQPRFDDSYLGGYYRVIIDPKELERTDWYAYTFDNFGTTDEGELLGRKRALEFIDYLATSWKASNEVMFRHGIPKEHFTGIMCPNEARRADLLKQLKDAGITEVNGVPIEDFVKVGNEI